MTSESHRPPRCQGKATLNDTDVVIQSAAFDGLGRRIRKTVTNSGDLDGVTVYLYNGQQIVETRDGSGNVEAQVPARRDGTRYIDEVVGLRVKDLGRLYASQDANWNVTALTDLTGRVIERYWYSPYGELEAVVAAHPFDYDDDGDVDADDYAVTTNGTCSGTATGDCRRLDANADGVVDSTDQAIIAAYIATLDSDTELQRVPAATHSRRGNLFAHQGLVLDPEIGSYQNRARQYAPGAMRFMQRDPRAQNNRAAYGFQDGINTYTRNRNSPCYFGDPMGLSAESDTCQQSGLGWPDGVIGKTVCDGNGGFVACYQQCCGASIQAGNGCRNGPPIAPGCYGGSSPGAANCPPPPPNVATCNGCDGLVATCICLGEQEHVANLSNPAYGLQNSCEGKESGENPLGTVPAGSYEDCFRLWSELKVSKRARQCADQNGQGSSCAEKFSNGVFNGTTQFAAEFVTKGCRAKYGFEP